MKQLHRPDLFCWSRFDEARDVDFNGTLWTRTGGNLAFDPMPLSEHDAEHARKLGGISWIVITNADHVRAAEELRQRFGAKVAAPLGERAAVKLSCDRWLSGGDELVPGLRAVGFEGGKTACEVAFVLEQTTLIAGDLIRGQRGGSLNLLPDAKLKEPARARECARRLLDFPRIDTVIVGDGWHRFGGGFAELKRILD